MDWDEMEDELDDLEDLYLLNEDDKQRLAGRGGCLGSMICLVISIIVILFFRI